MRKIYYLVATLFVVWQVSAQIWRQFDQNLYIIFCDVGQGDATLIYRRSAQVLVDGGPNSKVLECLSAHLPWFDRQLEVVVNTHPDQDHIGGLPQVLERYQVGTYVAPPVKGTNRAYERVTNLVTTQGLSVLAAVAGQKLKLSSLVLELIWPENIDGGGVLGDSTDNFAPHKAPNTASLVFNLSFSEFDLLMTGDIGQAEELALVQEGVLKKVEVLKVPHHGSKYSSSIDFLEAVKPDLAVIEVGEGNRYGHPTAEVLSRLDAVRARILRTDLDGEIRLGTDGKNFWRW